MEDTRPLTKHVDSSDENVDKACLSVSKTVPVAEDGADRLLEADQGNEHPIGDGQWNDIEATDSRIADVREVAFDSEGRSLDISVVSSPLNDQQEQGGSYPQDRQ
uniref:Uncharacterized protein n=2 Tax=Chenopodium quinoa TaxID=63459 RepID=A0A803LRK8_CHEQI